MSFVPDIEHETDLYVIGKRYGRLFNDAESYFEQFMEHTKSREFKIAVPNSSKLENYWWAVMHAKRAAIKACEFQKVEFSDLMQSWRNLKFCEMTNGPDTITEQRIKNTEELLDLY
jgi:hypothetical protein